MPKRQYYGIRYPFTTDEEEGYCLDLDKTRAESIKSMLCHLIFTPERQRIRRPTFGTRLLQYIFEPNDNITESDILAEINDKVALWIPNVTVDSTEAVRKDGDILVNIGYTITDGNKYAKDSITRIL